MGRWVAVATMAATIALGALAGSAGAQTPEPGAGDARQPVEVIAHRGSGWGFVDRDSPPENTLPAFRFGYAQGADAVELDVILSKDRVPMVIHDFSLERLAGTDVAVGDLTLRELKLLDVGSWKGERWAGTRIPTLAQVLRIVPPGRRIVVEIKEGPRYVDPTVEVIRRSGLSAEQVQLISFNYDAIKLAKARLPEHQALWLLSFDPRWQCGCWHVGFTRGNANDGRGRDVEEAMSNGAIVQMARRAGVDGLDTLFATQPGVPAALAAAGLDWVTWTVDTRTVAERNVAAGVDGITTDLPGEVVTWLAEDGVPRPAPAR